MSDPSAPPEEPRTPGERWPTLFAMADRWGTVREEFLDLLRLADQRDAEIAALREQQAALEGMLLRTGEALGCQFSSRPLELEAADLLAALREDKERLDWLECEAYLEQRGKIKNGALYRRNIPITRSAIDAARSSLPETPK